MKVWTTQQKTLVFEKRMLFLVPKLHLGTRATRPKIVFAQRFDCEKIPVVKSLAFTYWRDGDFWLGYLDEFSDYWTQGKSLDDLKDQLISIYRDLSSFA